MPAGLRIRANNVFGVTSNNPLSAAGTTLTSVELVLLPEISGEHAVLTLDPLRKFGEPEIVIVTAHSSSSQSATIVRGAYGTTPRAHPQETIWTHAAVDEDYVSIVTSVTRPTDPYQGQLIYETDTGELMTYDGSGWDGLVPAGGLSPTGTITAYGGSSAPSGWLICNGSIVSTATYPDLFAVIGYSYGGAGASFHLPNFEDRVPVGKGSAFTPLGATGGSKDAIVVSHNHTQNAHTHTQNAHSHGNDAHDHAADDNLTGNHTHAIDGDEGNRIAVSFAGAANGLAAGGAERATFSDIDDSGTHHHDIDVVPNTISIHNAIATNISAAATNIAAGVSGTNANMQPYQVVNYIIKI